MTVPFIQEGQGSYVFGNAATPTADFSGDLIKVTIKRSRNTITKPATYGNASEEQRLGAWTGEMTIRYLGDPATSASFYNLLMNEVEDDNTLYFDIKMQDAAVSATNPRHRGQILISELEYGAEAYTMWDTEVTFPIINYTRVLA